MKDESHEFDVEKLYLELCANIRRIDDISFKLLGLVPILSGTGVFTLVIKDLGWAITTPLSIIGIVLTFSLWLWERRNIDTCNNFRNAVISIEKRLPKSLPRPFMAVQNNKPKLFGILASKTRAENFIYGACLAFWLVPILKIFTQILFFPLR